MFLERMYACGFEVMKHASQKNNHTLDLEFRFIMQLFDLKNQFLFVLSCKKRAFTGIDIYNSAYDLSLKHL